MENRRVLADIDRKLTTATQHMLIRVHDGEDGQRRLQEIRDDISDPDFPSNRKNQYLRLLVRGSQDHGEPWTSAATSAMMPQLAQLVRGATRYYRTETEEAEAEVLISFIQALASVDPDNDDLAGSLKRETSRTTARSLRRFHRETPVENIELVGCLRSQENPSDITDKALYEVKMNEKRTVPESRYQVEGERWGALLHRFGIHG